MSNQPRLLSPQEKQALENRVLKALRSVTGQVAAKANILRPGLKYSDNENYVLIDSAVMQSELCQLLGGIISKMCEILGVELRLIENQYELPDDPELDQFLCGLLTSLDTVNLKSYRPYLKIDKKPYDLGKSTGFFLRIRGEVLRGSYKNVGLHGLKTCHRYFGNDSSRPTNEKERAERRSMLEVNLMRMFAKVRGFTDRYRDYFELITTLFQEIRLQGFSDEEVHNIIDNYQKSFEDVREQFERPIIATAKKGSKSKVQTGTRKPKRPNSSPTLLNVEFKEFIDPLINAHWISLEHFKKSFKENVRESGFSTTCRMIHDVYESRYEVSRNFSNLTTKRLQEARNYGLLDTVAKKTDFTDKVRLEFFEKRDITRRVNIFVDELKRLIPEKYRYDAIRKVCDGIAGVDAMSPNQLIQALSDKVAMAYPRANIGIGNYQHYDIKITNVREKEVRNIIEKISKCCALYKSLPGRLASVKRAVFTRKNEVKKLQNYILLKSEISELDLMIGQDFWTSSIAEDVWKAYYVTKTNIKDLRYFRKEIVESLHSVSKDFKETLESRDKKLFEPALDAKDVVKELTTLMDNLKI